MNEFRKHFDCPSCKGKLIKIEKNRFKCNICMSQMVDVEPIKNEETKHGKSDGKSFIET